MIVPMRAKVNYLKRWQPIPALKLDSAREITSRSEDIDRHS